LSVLQIEIVTARLALAAVCGGLIGYQRERRDRPAGFRTHILVSLGSALFMIVSEYGFGTPSDPTRIAAQVVTGIGFLGAGTIIRQGNYIVGLTTAASLWSVAAVGLAAGAGYYSAAVAGTIMIFLVLSGFKVLEEKIVTRRSAEHILTVTAEPQTATTGKIRETLTATGAEIVRVDLSRGIDNQAQLIFQFRPAPGIEPEAIAEQIAARPDVTRVRLEEVPETPGRLFSP